jgi:hypothetical protein
MKFLYNAVAETIKSEKTGYFQTFPSSIFAAWLIKILQNLLMFLKKKMN